jgi:hypothetical protein
MSHFAVMVIGNDPESQLAPYHEFECTGTDDQYVQDIDITGEAREGFAKSTESRLRAPDGVLHSFFDERGNWRPEFSKPVESDFPFDKTRRERHVPEGYEEVEVATATVESFAEWAEGWYGVKPVPFGQQPDLAGEHKYGYTLLDAAGEVVKVIDRTNPNKKWDWYELGGRWTGYLKLKDGDATRGAKIGRPGLMTDVAKPGRADQCRKRDIDIEGMRAEARAKAEERFDKIAALTPGLTVKTWAQVATECGEDGEERFAKTREAFWEQPFLKALREDRDLSWIDRDEIALYARGREAYVGQAADGAVCTFAVVKDGQWFERGRMGWWACVSDGKDKDEWAREFTALFDALPDDTRISVYDCHI